MQSTFLQKITNLLTFSGLTGYMSRYEGKKHQTKNGEVLYIFASGTHHRSPYFCTFLGVGIQS